MYCFDTDTVSAMVWQRPPLPLVRRLARTPTAEQCTTAITVAELLYGSARRGSPRLHDALSRILTEALPVMPFDRLAAERFAALRHELETAGTPLRLADLQIAATALASDHTLVTGNVRHFERVPGLRVENWLEEA